MRKTSLFILTTLGTTLAFNGLDAGAATLNVPGTYPSIQSAVNAASPGDTIQVAAGSYAENVNVPVANLIINGAQAGAGITARTSGGPSESTVIGANPNNGNAVFALNAAGVTIDGFTIRNALTLGAAYGIAVNSSGANAAIMNNIFDGISTADTSGNGTAQAVYLQGGPDNVQILGNRMWNISSARSAKGVLMGDNGAVNPSVDTVIEGNSISNITSTARGAYGVSVANTPGVSGLVIRDNAIDTLTSGGWVHAIGLEGDTPGVTVDGNTITNFVAASPDQSAVYFESNPSFSTAQVHNNNFDVGTNAFGIAVHPALSGAPLNGTCNWWGAPNGPGPLASGGGAKVGPNVTYSPWLLAPAPGGVCSGAVVATENQCKNGGWKTVFRADGTSFKNQGDCLQYVITGQ
jgi:hypothetical protein